MKIIGPCQSKMQHAFLRANMESLCLKFLIYFYASVSIACLHWQGSPTIQYLLEFALSSKQLSGHQAFALYSCPCNGSASTFMVQPRQKPSEKPHTGRVVSNTSTSNRKRKRWWYLQIRVQKPWINISHLFNFLILRARVFFRKGSRDTHQLFWQNFPCTAISTRRYLEHLLQNKIKLRKCPSETDVWILL